LVQQNDNVASATTGASRPEQVAVNAKAGRHRLSAETLAGIDEVLSGSAASDPAQAGPAAPQVTAVA
jgi:aryl-alcohol dehydrogenase-like predicted oxidoreductase